MNLILKEIRRAEHEYMNLPPPPPKKNPAIVTHLLSIDSTLKLQQH